MTKKKIKAKPKAKPLRAIVYVSGGVADIVADRGVDVEIVDWDNMRDSNGGWTPTAIAAFEAWGAGLVSQGVLRDLSKYAVPEPKDDQA